MTIIEIVLSKSQADELRSHSRKNIPNESCAILFGKINTGKIIVEKIFLTQNIDNSPDTFSISNEDLIKAYDLAEKQSLDVVGIFHSHPLSIAYPSETDRKYMEINPVPWIIFSSSSNEFKGYILDSVVSLITIKIV